MTPKLTRDRKTTFTLPGGMVEKFAFCLLCMAALGGTVTSPVQAEGSREMVADGGDRPFTEWAGSTTAGIPRQTLLQVYVQAGETIYLGSSVHASAYDPPDDNDPGDIVYRTPSGDLGTCDVLSSGFGFIDTVDKETAGPAPVASGGYTPCEVNATETGFYEVEFWAPSLSGNPPTRTATEAFPTGSNQNSGVAAWDITVANASGVAQPGRVFTSYVALNMGSNGQNLASAFYIQTWDGYLYRTDMNDVDPYGFIFYGNSKGFLDSDGTILYHSVVATENTLSNFTGGATVQYPTALNNPATNDYTHLIFFNPPDSLTLAALGIAPPIAPQPPADFRFVGDQRSDNQTLEGAGGYFEFTVPGGSSYRIILDTNTDGVFDTSTDVVLEDVLVAGYNRVDWDGNDASGNPLPTRTEPYDARIVIRSGEYHFPMLDAEFNQSGFIIQMLNAPVQFPALEDSTGQQIGPFTVYYNDSNYSTANGLNVSLDGSGATTPRDASQGIDSSSGEHEFSNRYGDFKGIDTWAYFPSEAVIAPVIVTDTYRSPGLVLVKRLTAINGTPITSEIDGINSPGDANYVPPPQDQDDNDPHWPTGLLLGDIYRQDLQPGDEVEFTVYFLSNGGITAQNALFCDLVPANMDFVTDAFASIPAASGPSPVPGITSGGERGIVLGLGTQSTTDPYPIEVSLSNSDDSDAGRYIAPNIDLTTVDSRLSSCGSNTNGAIVVNLGDLPDATGAGDPPDSYGFVRFRGRIR
jgi:uncharacterized repeat protein (TIGR01451 family)